MRFFWKIGKIAIFSIKLTSNLTIWVENSKKLEFSGKTGAKFLVEGTKYLAKLIFYTIENTKLKIVRKSHLLLRKVGIFSSATAIVSTNRYKLLLCKNIKAAIDCSYIYCEGRYGKVLQMSVFLFKCTIVFIGVINLIDNIT